MSNDIDLATALFGNKRLENGTSESVKIMTGTAVSDSSDGKVKVVIDGVTTGEEYDGELQDNVIELDTNPNVKEGDIVQITAYGGVSNSMIVTGVIGNGDSTKADVDAAQDAASSAQTAADDARKVATNYISIDDNEGITVGNMTEETLGKNTYIDANGFYVRDGETELAKFSGNEGFIGIYKQDETATLGLLRNSETNIDSLQISAKATGIDWEQGRVFSTISGDYSLFICADQLAGISTGSEYMSMGIPSGVADNIPRITISDGFNELLFYYTLEIKQGIYKKTNDVEGEILGETVLFNNASQAMSGKITLSQDCTKFIYLDVYCKDNDGSYIHQRVYNPVVDRKFTVMSMHSNANDFFIKYKRFAIADTTTINTVQNSDGSYACGEYSGSFSQSDVLNIIRVVGVA